MVTKEEYALLTAASYHRDDPNVTAPLPPGWEVLLDPEENGLGFDARVFRNSAGEIVIAYTGTTPGMMDWVSGNIPSGLAISSPQIYDAIELYSQVRALNPNATITVTGHSLGGGLASLIATYFNLDAAIFDPAPFENSATDSDTVRSYYLYYVAYQLFHGRDIEGSFTAYAAAPGLLFPFRETNVSSYVLLGEILHWVRAVADPLGFGTIFGEGQEEYFDVGETRLDDGPLARMTLHSMDLLAAVMNSSAFNTALRAIPNSVDMLFDETLYGANSESNGTTRPDFLRFLLRNHFGVEGTQNETGNGMLERFAADLMKLVNGGGGTAAQTQIREGLIAIAMNYYYSTNHEVEGGTVEEFFSTDGGAITFDMARIPADGDHRGFQRFRVALRELSDPTEAAQVERIAPLAHYFIIQSGNGALSHAGTGANDVIVGGAGGDTLSGGVLSDAILGLGGNDTLEGGDGNDVLIGGDGLDSLDGGEHDDWLSGGEGDDILIGGTGSDVLRGGGGIDQYRFQTGDGADVIEDSDGQGVIQVDGGVLQAGERISETKWRSVGGTLILERREVAGGYNLVITDAAGTFAITIKNWTDGMFEIELADDEVPLPEVAANPPNSTVNVISGDLNPLLNADDEIVYDQWGNVVPDGNAPDRDDVIFDTPGADLILAGGGADRVHIVRGGGDVVDGGFGDDHIDVDGISDTDLLGGAGRDWIQASRGGADIIEGGVGEDVMHGYEGADQIFGDSAVLIAAAIETGRAADNIDAYGDLIDGGQGEDTLVGTATKDLLSGGSGRDLLIAGAGKDFISGDGNYQATLPNGQAGSWDWSISLAITEDGETRTYTYSIVGGSTYDDGGEGDADIIYAGNGDDDVLAGEGADEVYGEDGNDIIFGDEGNDTLIGGAGDDLLDGGDPDEDPAGRDFLDGGEGNDKLSGADGNDVLFGGAGNDTLSGDDGNELDGDDYLDGEDGDDELSGGGGIDTMFGGAGNDRLFGESGDTPEERQAADFLDGGAGNDVLSGGGGGDTVYGGEGDDELFGESSDTPEAVQGSDLLDGGVGNDVLSGGGGRDHLLGGEGNDRLFGESSDTPEAVHDDDYLDGGVGEDTLVGEGGDDTLIGGEGNDELFGESSSTPDAVQGSDLLDGGVGNDTLGGGGGSDFLFGGDGDDLLFGDSSALAANLHGNDLLEGGAGNDQLQGNRGDDTLLGGDGEDVLFGMEDNDSLAGGSGEDSLQGGDGDDTLTGGADNDSLFGQEGNDFLSGGDGDDIVSGGAGDDVLSGGEGSDLYVIGLGSGVDRLADSLRSPGGFGNRVSFQFGLFGTSLLLGLGSLRISFADRPGDELHIEGFDVDNPFANPPIDLFTFTDTTLTYAQLLALGFDIGGTPDADFLTGTGANDRIEGLASNDWIIAKAGDDRLDGGAGADRMQGGAGNDTFIVDDAGDLVEELVDEGADTVQSSITYTLTENVESLTLTGAAPIDGTGNALDNSIAGNDANNRIDGAAGADAMAGGLGDDTYIVDDFGDSVTEGADAGTDLVESSVSHSLSANVENLTLTGTADVNGTGNVLANIILGNSGANVLDGGAGADTLTGGAGDDTYVVDTAGDVVNEAPGEGIDTVRAGISYTIGADLENLTLLEGAALDGTGNAVGNVINGNSNANLLLGLGGNDTISGGGGDDTLAGGEGDDELRGDAGNDILTGSDGADELFGDIGDDNLSGDAGADTLMAGAGTDTLAGGDGVDTLLAGAGDDTLSGGDGDDTLSGEDGADLLDGGVGADSMTGGANADTYVIDNVGDSIIELGADNEQDVVEASVTYSLGQDALVELYVMTGDAAIDVTGNQHTTIYEGNSAANVMIDVAGGDDILWGNAGNDTLITGEGNNILDGGTDVDHMEGGGGSDVYYVDETADVIVENLNAGYEEVYATATYTLSANLEYLSLFGEIDGTGNDIGNIIDGSDDINTIRGLVGDDELYGWAGNDIIEGGDGNDWIDGEFDNDLIDGGAGDDYLRDWYDENTLIGGAGNDTFDIRSSQDPVIIELAGEGTDRVISSASHVLAANVENLRLVNTVSSAFDIVNGTGNELDNQLVGTDFRNTLSGLAGNDIIDGRAGDDVLLGGDGDDDIFGGHDRAGDDEDEDTGDFLFFYHENSDLIEAGAGNDNVDGGSGNDEIYGDDGDDVLYGGDDEIVFSGGEGGYGGYGGGEGGYGGYGGGEGYYLSNDDIIEGGLGDDDIDGGSGNDELYGGDGADTLYGGNDGPYNFEGYDWLDGGAGIDYMAGGTWDDTYWVDGTYVEEADPTAVDECGLPIPGATRRIWTTDVIFEEEDEGFDTVYSSASIVLPANFERVILTGEENLDATSGAGDQILVGNDAANRLEGGAGADLLSGGLGNDTLVVDSLDDELEEYEDEGTDTVESSIDFTLGLNLENLTLTGGAVTGTGNAGANVIRGNVGGNVLFGMEGNDELNGAGGNDELRGGDGDDVYRFGVGSGQDVVHDVVGLNSVRLLGDLTAADLTLSQSGDDLVLTIDATGDSLRLVGWSAVAPLSSGNVLLCECGCPVDFNAPPVAFPDVANVVEDVTFTASGNVLANDIDSDAGTTLSVTDPRTVVGTFGTLALAADGSYTFTLDNAAVQSLAVGQTLSQVFNYTITDSHASDPETSTSTLTVVVTGTNDAPVANDDAGSVAEDGALTTTGNALANDTDVDQGTTLSVTNPTTIAGTYGTLTLAADGTYTYTLNNTSAAVQSLGQGETELETFGYTAADNGTPALTDTANIVITVAGANDAPVLVTPLEDQSTDAGEAFAYTVPASAFTDIDRNDALSFTATLADGSALPPWLTFDATTRQFSGTPPAGIATSYDVRVVATDLFGASANDVFTINIAVPDPTSDTLHFTKDGCWSSGSVSAGGVCLDGLEQTHSVYDGGAGIDTLVGSECGDAILLEDEISPRPPGTSGPRIIGIEIIDAGGGNDVVDLSSTLYPYGRVTVHGGEGDDIIIGGSGANTLHGDGGCDTLVGGASNDVLDGGQSCDTMSGGLGNDEYHVDDVADVVVEECDSGTDTVISSVSVCLAANVENLVLVGAAAAGHGNELDNVITGSSGDNVLSGGEGTDTLRGGAGNDIYGISVTDGADVIVELAGEGTDEVRSLSSFVLSDNVENLTLVDVEGECPLDINATGNSAANVLTGNSGANVLDGAGGADMLIGGAGDDTYIVEGSDDTITELVGGGVDTVRSAQSHALSANVENLELLGSDNVGATGNALDNVLTGNSGNNLIDGGAGNDTLRGGAGADTYHFSAGFGQDVVEDTIVVDPVSGAPDEDASVDAITFDASISAANVVLNVGSSNPRDLRIDIAGTGESITLRNFLADDAASDRIEEIRFSDGTTWTSAYVLSQFDRVFGTEGDDQLAAAAGGSLVYGRGGADTLTGGAGNDVLDGGSGGDGMTGGGGDDLYLIDDWSDAVHENAGEGTDTVYATASLELSANVENAVLEGSDWINATGNALDNTLTGNAGGNTLDGGAGTDTMRGGAGDDTYVVDSTSDVVIENAGGGWDHIHTSISLVLVENVEGIEMEGTGNIDGTGNAAGNELIGNNGNNHLDGGAGADYMAGRGGNDTYEVDSEGDQVVEISNGGSDVVRSSVSFTLGSHVENLVLLGTGNINGTGNSLVNVLTGNAGNNALNGGGGADQMSGGAGDDTYTVNVAGDQVFENAGEGVDTVRSSVSYTLGSNLENLTLTGSAIIDGTGNALDNVLTGNSAANRLEGGAGNDTLTGAGGADTMIGGTGDDTYFVNATNDVVTENAGEGFDIVNTTVTGTLADNIEALFASGSSGIALTGNALDNLIRGNSGNNALDGGAGIDILEGGGGADTLTDTSGSTLFNGGTGTDTMNGSSISDLFLGGAGNDVLNTGGGADLIVFNRGDGRDTVNASTGTDDTLSLGHGILYSDLIFRKSGNNLILVTGANEQLTFVDWYASPQNRSVDRLQLIIEGTSDHDSASSDPLRNQAIQGFDFEGLVAAFDAAQAANPTLTNWALTNALASFHLGGSNTAAVGGDLAYRYGRDGTLADISFIPAAGILGAAGFGGSAQMLLPIGTLQDTSPRIGP